MSREKPKLNERVETRMRLGDEYGPWRIGYVTKLDKNMFDVKLASGEIFQVHYEDDNRWRRFR